MSSNALQRLTNKKGKQLSKFLGIDSGPSTRLIANMQARINNPLFKLSMTDYEVMCGNKMMIKMMSKVLGCEEKQLKKFCKYINVFTENIKSSPKSIKNKIIDMKSLNASKRRGSLNTLPDNVYSVIVKQYKKLFRIKYVLKDWVLKEELNWNMLSGNPNAIELLKANPKRIYWKLLSRNPNAIELLTANQDNIDWDELSANPNAIELLTANQDKIYWSALSLNPNAIELLKANPEKINWEMLSTNPNAIELLKSNIDEINWSALSVNPNAIDLLRENMDEIDWEEFMTNPNAIGLIKENLDEVIDNYGLYGLSANQNTEAIELLQKYPKYISEPAIELSGNPNPKAIELLRDNINIIDWRVLSRNPSLEAIKLLREHPKKIDWKLLSANPSIFEEIIV